MLADYLASIARRGWQPGQLDCCIFMADWCVVWTGCDPMPDRRGRYGARNFRRLIRSEGGLVASCTTRFSRIGLVEGAPAAGHPAIALVPYAVRRDRLAVRATGAICVSPTMTAVITPDRGLIVSSSLRLIKVWGLGHHA